MLLYTEGKKKVCQKKIAMQSHIGGGEGKHEKRHEMERGEKYRGTRGSPNP
jgi:hypothetical protein